MIPSILALLALPDAHAVQNAAQLQTAIQAACSNVTDDVVTIRIPGDLVLEPDEVVVYPDPTVQDCIDNPSVPDLVFEPETNVVRGSVRFQVQTDPTASNAMFTFSDGVNATFRNIDMSGIFTGEPGTEDTDGDYVGESYSPVCAALGGNVRGIVMDSSGVGGPTRGELVVDGGNFECLNALGSGGAIQAINSFVTIRNASFTSNSATSFGGALSIEGAGFTAANGARSLVVENSRFSRNAALLGGAISNDWDEMNTEISFSKFSINFGSLGAGGVDLTNQRNVTMEYNEFDRQNPLNVDIAQEGGAVRIDSSGLYDAVIEPTAAERGSLEFRNNILCGSLAGRGGGLFVNSMPDVEISNSVFAENIGLDLGGGMHLENEVGSFEPNMSVVHNTFVGNEAGRTPRFVQPTRIFTLGGGAAASFFGVNPEFRNNIVSEHEFGGGVFVEYEPFTSSGFQIGDEFDYYNNLWYLNEDGQGSAHLTGDVANLALHPSNVLDVDPLLAYTNLGEYNCVPEAFYPLLASPAVDTGGGPPTDNVPGPCQDWADIDSPSDFTPDRAVEGDVACDIGAFGGEGAMWSKDTDLDGFTNIFDCDDNDATRNPGAPELCDFQDNDCDGLVDEGIQSVWYPDNDQDGFGQQGVAAVFSCTPVQGHVSSVDETPINTDCDDTNATSNPDSAEICDDLDNNCDGLVDEGLDSLLYFSDDDGDQFGGFQYPGTFCAPPVQGAITAGGDCNDGNPAVNPEAAERCGNNVDDDCDGFVDAADSDAGANQFFIDADGDGDGNINSTPQFSCASSPPEGFAAVGGDCNDNQPEINSINAIELCNTFTDEDCDGVIDEADVNSDARVFFADADGDSFGNPASIVYTCDAVAAQPGFVENADDCNDGDALIGECTGGGCSTVGTSGGAFGALVGALMLMGRRRRD